jgi:hypothetical protein
VPSGTYDPAAARQRFAEWKAKQVVAPAPAAAAPVATPPVNAPSKSGAATAPPADYDPEVGF